AWVICADHAATVVITNVAMPRHPIRTELVNVRLSDTPAPRTAWIERIDDDHANPRQLWEAMGEPEYLSALQVRELQAASALQKESQPWSYAQGNTALAVAVPPQSVAALTIEFA